MTPWKSSTSKLKLDKYEKELLAAYESGNFDSELEPKRAEELKKVARNTRSRNSEELLPRALPRENGDLV